MTLSEPTTMLTDYALAGVCTYLSARILSQKHSEQPARIWGIAFIFISLSALAGGTWHGFQLIFENEILILLWKITVYGIGFFNLLILCAAIISIFSGLKCYWLLALVLMKFMVYGVWMLNHDDFIYVALDSAPTMLLLLLLHGYSHFAHKDQGSIWIVSGVIVAGIAALVQVLKIAPHPEFNHNDLFHVIQIVSMILLYRGGRKLKIFDDNHPTRNLFLKIRNQKSLKSQDGISPDQEVI